MIHTAFSQFSFLYEKSSDRVVQHLFPDKKITNITIIDPMEGAHKKDTKAMEASRILIMDLEKSEILTKLEEFRNARQTIQRLCIDEKDCRLFRIRTKQAKEDLITKADENIQRILARLKLIIEFNIDKYSFFLYASIDPLH